MNNKYKETFFSKNTNDIPIYYINLNKNKDRLQIIQKQIVKYNIKNIFRSEAVNGSQLSNGSYKFSDNTILNYNISGYSGYSMNELGCTLAHINTIKKSYDNGDNYSIIVDDIYFGLVPFWKESINDIIKKAPKDWQILQLFISEINDNMFKDSFTHWNDNKGSISYLINRNGMKHIIDILYKDNTIILHKDKIDKHIINKKFKNEMYNDILLYNILVTYIIEPLFIPDNTTLKTTIGKFNDYKAIDTSIQITDQYINNYKNNINNNK